MGELRQGVDSLGFQRYNQSNRCFGDGWIFYKGVISL